MTPSPQPSGPAPFPQERAASPSVPTPVEPEDLGLFTQESEPRVLEIHPASRKSKITLAAAAAVVVVAIFALIFGSMFSSGQKSAAENRLLESGSTIVDDWMDNFQEVGENELILGAPNSQDDSAQSMALQDLKRSLETLSDDGVNLHGVKVTIKPGKKYVFSDVESETVLMTFPQPEIDAQAPTQ